MVESKPRTRLPKLVTLRKAIGSHNVIPYAQVFKLKYTNAKSQMRGFANVLKSVGAAGRGRTLAGATTSGDGDAKAALAVRPSLPSVAVNQLHSGAESHAASCGRSMIRKRAKIPSRTAGRPSRRNSHRQPASPWTLCKPRSAPESGPPRMPETGPAVINMATTRARACAGNQLRK